MASTYEDTVLDFDLNFLHHHSSAVQSKLDRQYKSVLVVKKKTLQTNLIIEKYFKKKEALDQAEKALFASKEECKQLCIDYKSVLEKCAELENKAEVLQNTNRGLEEKYSFSENRFGALQSHINQLQALIKENETKIESLKIEKQLEKSNVKAFEKKVSSLQAENKILIQHICLLRDITIGKKKLRKKYKKILEKYEKFSSDSFDDVLSEGETSGEEMDLFEDSPLSLSNPATEKDTNEVHISPHINTLEDVSFSFNNDSNGKPSPRRHDTDDSSPITSEDTGRGSSPSFSESENLHSPDYFANHNLGGEIEKEQIDRAVSPITIFQTKNVATSPISVSGELSLSFLGSKNCLCSSYYVSKHNLREKTETERTNSTASPITLCQIRHIATSPINFEHESGIPKQNKNMYKDVATSTVHLVNQTSLTPKIMIDKAVGVTFSDISVTAEVATSPVNVSSNNENPIQKEPVEKEVLELNSSNSLCGDYNDDSEVQMILNTMRLNYELITPIPSTPAKSRGADTVCSTINRETDVRAYMCPDAAKVAEENKSLREKIVDLAKEVINIKNILNKHSMIEEHVCDKTQDLVVRHDLSVNNEQEEVLMTSSKNTENNPTLKTLCPEYTSMILDENQHITSENIIETDIINLCDNTEENGRIEPKSNDSCDRTFMKSHKSHHNVKKKLSKIQRPKKDSLFKNKIKKNILKRKLPKNKLIDLSFCKKNIKELSATSNDKLVYKKVLKVMDKLEQKSTSKSKTDISNTDTRKDCALSKLINVCESNVSQSDINQIKEVNKNNVEQEKSPMKSQRRSSRTKSQNECQIETDVISLFGDIERNGSIEPELIDSCDRINTPIKPLLSDRNDKKIAKPKKLSKLQKIKKDSLPKSKIKKVTLPTKRKFAKLKSIPSFPSKKNIKESDSSVTLNDKTVYEKALKVMAELRRKGPSDKKTDMDDQKDCLDSERNVVDCSGSLSYVNQIQRRNKSNIEHEKSPVILQHRTRSQSNCLEKVSSNTALAVERCKMSIKVAQNKQSGQNEVNCTTSPQVNRAQRKRLSNEKSEIQTKRILRSSGLQQSMDSCKTLETGIGMVPCSVKLIKTDINDTELTTVSKPHVNHKVPEVGSNCNKLLNYADIDMFTETMTPVFQRNEETENCNENEKTSILCVMLEKYGRHSVKSAPKKLPDSATICNKIEEGIATIIKVPASRTNDALNKFVGDIQQWKPKHFLAGLMIYLKDPTRKIELYNKVNVPLAPPMTKSEEILLYVLKRLRVIWSSMDIVTSILSNIEYALFKLNSSPDFDTIESMSHFYAIVCSYFGPKSRLRLFILDAMYCIQYKAVPLIRQCLDVWMHILPLAHMGIAKSPLVKCLVYLLHFYKCEDRFHRVQDIRNILHRKYSYQMTDWNETKMLEMFTNSIKELKDIPIERKMLERALIILAKRKGPRWCQKNIIRKMLQPLIEKEKVNASVKEFCVSIIGPLMKPFPPDMKVHCEIAMNQLLDMLSENPSEKMQEAIITSLIYMSRHNQNRVVQVLLSWKPKRVSSELEELLRNYVREKPIKMWRNVLYRIDFEDDF